MKHSKIQNHIFPSSQCHDVIVLYSITLWIAFSLQNNVCDLLEDPEGSLVAWIRVAQATATKINCEFMKQCKNNVEEPRRLLNNVLLATSRLLFYEANTFASGRIKFRRGSSVGEAEHLRNPWWIILYCLQAGRRVSVTPTQAAVTHRADSRAKTHPLSVEQHPRFHTIYNIQLLVSLRLGTSVMNLYQTVMPLHEIQLALGWICRGKAWA